MSSFARRMTLALAATTALALSATPSAVVAAPAPDERKLGTYVFRFTFDKGESLNPGTRVRDVTGHGNYGIVEVSGRGRLRVDEGIKGRGADYPASCKRCGRALIRVADGRGMDPQRRPFSFGAAVKVGDRQARPKRDPNIVQKGFASQGAVQWKLELQGAKPQCVLRGGRGTVIITSRKSVDDNRWHRLECRKVGRSVTLLVDGTVAASTQGATGRIRNKAPVTVGGRAVGARSKNDQYHGDLDNVFYTIKRKS